MVTFQPRWVFDDLNGSTAFGRNMSRLIRSRLEAYDQAPIHPQLGWYGGKDNREWKQYFSVMTKTGIEVPVFLFKEHVQQNEINQGLAGRSL